MEEIQHFLLFLVGLQLFIMKSRELLFVKRLHTMRRKTAYGSDQVENYSWFISGAPTAAELHWYSSLFKGITHCL